jgi:YfiH family protein
MTSSSHPPAFDLHISPGSMVVKSEIVGSPEDLARSSTEIPYLQFPGLSAHSLLKHAVYTRHGGVSEPPYHHLNVSRAVGDEAEHVAVNLGMIQQALGARHLAGMKQVHGSHILVLTDDRARGLKKSASQADAMVTNLPGVALMVRQADCQAVILMDPDKGVIANVHCGWRGNTANLLGKVIRRMKDIFGCDPAALYAAVGPSLGPCCAEFTTFDSLFPESFRRFMVKTNYLDLWEVSRWQLLQAGLRKDRIEVAGLCTRCRTDLFYSYRGEGTTGRFATVAMQI